MWPGQRDETHTLQKLATARSYSSLTDSHRTPIIPHKDTWEYQQSFTKKAHAPVPAVCGLGWYETNPLQKLIEVQQITTTDPKPAKSEYADALKPHSKPWGGMWGVRLMGALGGLLTLHVQHTQPNRAVCARTGTPMHAAHPHKAIKCNDSLHLKVPMHMHRAWDAPALLPPSLAAGRAAALRLRTH